ncbi:MAG: PDDEXK nuclease domain-containing protein [Verrucomicrobiota bacterium]|nr:PDDEXK nuclease domain-containing protein [Verrucomicrobiota bacterium]
MKITTSKKVAPVVRQLPKSDLTHAFTEVLHIIQSAKARVAQTVNTELVTLYWHVGEYISRKIESAEWGDKVVAELAHFLGQTQPGLRGFTRPNLFRMRQLYETYRANPIVSPLVRQLPWTHNMIILSQTRRDEEREFYVRMAIREKWTKRELERQIRIALFERAVINPPKVAATLRQIHPLATEFFKDIYTLEFLGLPTEHSEADLEGALLRNLGRFITELGRDFCFIGSQYPIQVGGQDFALDLLFFHRGMNCLVAIELKIREFRPEDLGKINFYLEALDRDYRKPHENPSVGLLLCATKDAEVVEYCLSRSLSPAMIAEYETMLPDKELLKAKLHEFYQLCTPAEEDSNEAHTAPTKPKRKSKGVRVSKSQKEEGATIASQSSTYLLETRRKEPS